MNHTPKENESFNNESGGVYEERNEEYHSPREERSGGGSFFTDLIRFTLISVAIVIPFRIFIASPFIVEGSSMDPTFHTGDYLIVDQLSYRLGEPERGDILIFRYPNNPSRIYIKRAIGLPGETVIIDGRSTTIVSSEYPEGLELSHEYVTHPAQNGHLEITLADDEYFVLGDNRASSSDSRVWGPLPERLIIGQPIIRLYPVRGIGLMPGDVPPNVIEQ